MLATVPNDVFERLLDPARADGYRARSRSIEYFAALCLLLELDRPFTRSTGPTWPTASCRSSG